MEKAPQKKITKKMLKEMPLRCDADVKQYYEYLREWHRQRDEISRRSKLNIK